MTNLRKAAEMALKSLEEDPVPLNAINNAQMWLRQALAQPEQEPVAGMFEEKLPDQNPPPWVRDYKEKGARSKHD